MHHMVHNSTSHFWRKGSNFFAGSIVTRNESLCPTGKKPARRGHTWLNTWLNDCCARHSAACDFAPSWDFLSLLAPVSMAVHRSTKSEPPDTQQYNTIQYNTIQSHLRHRTSHWHCCNIIQCLYADINGGGHLLLHRPPSSSRWRTRNEHTPPRFAQPSCERPDLNRPGYIPGVVHTRA